MMRLATSLALGATILLSACSGGSESSSTQAAQLQSYLDAVREVRAPKEPQPELTRALIDSLPSAALEIVVEKRGATVFAVPYSDRTDRRKGAIRIWRSGDSAQFVFREGVLIATRGIGNDVDSSRVLSVLNTIETLTPVSGPHNLFVKDFDNSTRRIDLDCTMQSLGNTTIDIVQRKHDVIHFRESCIGPDLNVVNDYWVGRSDRTVWKSRQWSGPKIGYIRTRLLKK